MNTKDFAVKLINAETEKRVIEILKEYNYWENNELWLPFGANENNFSAIGNQQSKADAALVEKLINSIDAVLLRNCLERGIIPESQEAPQDMKAAQKVFFDIPNGKLSETSPKHRNELSQNIFLVSSGTKNKVNYSIIDSGEGQTPKRLHETILSLSTSNKLKIPFVQGKFNMGGTGVLPFSGDQKFQVIVSKRSTKIPEWIDKERFGEDKTRDYWGVTVVRREDPKDGRKSSMYTYLAPRGDILSFESDTLNLLPGTNNENKPEYATKEMNSGTFMKVFDYRVGGLKTVSTLNLSFRLSTLLTELVIPIRIIETRTNDYKGNTLETSLYGLNVRLEEDGKNNNKKGNIDFKILNQPVNIRGNKISYDVYVFKESAKLEKYKDKEGVIFTVNGQTHGDIHENFFKRKNVGLSYLSDSMLVIVDCSNLDVIPREDLFMNSRDKLRDGELKKEFEEFLEDELKNNSKLKEIQNMRRKEALENKVNNSKPIADILQKIIKTSPSIASLFKIGGKVSTPFDLEGKGENKQEYQGFDYPEFFTFKKRNMNKAFIKDVHMGEKIKIEFVTNANDDYFTRENDCGELVVFCGVEEIVDNYSYPLSEGSCMLKINLPNDAKVGSKLEYKVKVWDSTRLHEPFIETFVIVLKEKNKNTKPSGPKPPKRNTIAPPQPVPVYRDEWYKHNFDEEGSLSVKSNDDGYDFFVNMHNKHLLNETRFNCKTEQEMEIMQNQYKFAIALFGITIIDYLEKNNEEDLEGRIFEISKMITPMILPVINNLSNLND